MKIDSEIATAAVKVEAVESEAMDLVYENLMVAPEEAQVKAEYREELMELVKSEDTADDYFTYSDDAYTTSRTTPTLSRSNNSNHSEFAPAPAYNYIDFASLAAPSSPTPFDTYSRAIKEEDDTTFLTATDCFVDALPALLFTSCDYPTSTTAAPSSPISTFDDVFFSTESLFATSPNFEEEEEEKYVIGDFIRSFETVQHEEDFIAEYNELVEESMQYSSAIEEASERFYTPAAEQDEEMVEDQLVMAQALPILDSTPFLSIQETTVDLIHVEREVAVQNASAPVVANSAVEQSFATEEPEEYSYTVEFIDEESVVVEAEAQKSLVQESTPHLIEMGQFALESPATSFTTVALQNSSTQITTATAELASLAAPASKLQLPAPAPRSASKALRFQPYTRPSPPRASVIGASTVATRNNLIEYEIATPQLQLEFTPAVVQSQLAAPPAQLQIEASPVVQESEQEQLQLVVYARPCSKRTISEVEIDYAIKRVKLITYDPEEPYRAALARERAAKLAQKESNVRALAHKRWARDWTGRLVSII